ncbi:complement receptor type 1-like isoform X2 [Mastacembelus armatus]|uniref:complement receptor type 1-like isoform X2 n=1 Tax=Mastacembelus armatus TaxID=205130 RepID=UPI000E45F041|nr:complement receptor type 1-like isoform X2 [Mastacembelus armatus]
MRSLGWSVLLLSLTSLATAAIPKSCSAPPEYPHTSLDTKVRAKKGFQSGDKVYYNCAEDFTPTRGSRSVQCNNGEWTKLTLKCEKKSCGNAGDLPNGQFHYEGSSFVGEKVYAVCNEGYTSKGVNYMICKKSGWTGEFPICEVGETTCPAPAVANSVTSGGNAFAYQVGDDVSFTCRQGFQLDGAQKIICMPGGLWEPKPPQCLPQPQKTEQTTKSADKSGCGVPLTHHNANANLAGKYITRTSFASGEKVHYVCNIGHVQAGGSKYRTCTDGKWTPLELKCERKLCGSAGEILNGEFSYTGVMFGDTATANCNEGYILVGKATRNCLHNGWDGRVPVCEAVQCEKPPEVANAKMIGLQEQSYTYMSVVYYQCHVGILIGEKEIWCTENGTWSASPPQCKEITCQSPNVPKGFWRGAHNGLYHFRDTISIMCSRGYTITGPTTITCGSDGKWSPGLPNCKPMYHRKLRN